MLETDKRNKELPDEAWDRKKSNKEMETIQLNSVLKMILYKEAVLSKEYAFNETENCAVLFRT